MTLETEAVLDRRRMRRRVTFWRSAAIAIVGLMLGALLLARQDGSSVFAPRARLPTTATSSPC
jgi:protease-4